MKIRVVCPTCGAIYNVPEERLTAPRVHATCKVCSGRVEFARPEETTTHDAVRDESASMEMIEPSESSTTAPEASAAEGDAPTDAPPEDDRPTRQQRLAPIPADPEERETGTWEKAIIDNAEADALVGEIEGTIPPERPKRPPLDPSTGLGNQTIRDPADLDELFPEDNPLPPPELAPAPAPTRRPAADAARKPRNLRRRRSRLPMVLLVLSFLVVAAAAVYYFRDQIMSAL